MVRAIAAALVSFTLAGCGALALDVPLTVGTHPCTRYAQQGQYFDAYAQEVARRIGTPALGAALIHLERRMQAAYDGLPNDRHVPVTPGLRLAFAEYRLALGAAQRGEAEMLPQYARSFVEVVALAESEVQSGGC